MWRRIFLAVMLGVIQPAVLAQDLMDAVLFLTGASSPEELDADVLDRYEALASRPLRINTATEARMVSSGLLSRYQAASVADYRRSSGDILSVAELALLDGFGEASARALAPFVSFDTRALPGRSSLERGSVETEFMARAALQGSAGKVSGSGALKIRTGNEDRWTVGLAAKLPALAGPSLKEAMAGAALWPPETASVSMAYYGRKRPWKVLLGDFNTRFGQGLLLWSGFSLSGVQSAAAMDRHPSGLSPAWTLSPGAVRRGVAADLMLGRFALSGFCTVDGLAGANVTWLARLGQLGVTALSVGRVSADWRWSPGKWDLFGEAAWDAENKCGAVVAGGAWNPAYLVRLAASVRSYPAAFDGSLAGALRSSTRTADERGASLAFDYKKLSLTTDAVVHPSKETAQLKTVLKYSPQVFDRLALAFRVVNRYRPKDPFRWRNELRAEAVYGPTENGFSLKGCAAACRSAEFSWLAYLEGGYVAESPARKVSFYLRGTAFKVDRWEDRIYIYERDVPGAFSVPAWYGRGCALSAVASLKLRHASLHARAYATGYPGMVEKKPGKAGLRFQCQFTF